jgi:hypothetical protein
VLRVSLPGERLRQVSGFKEEEEEKRSAKRGGKREEEGIDAGSSNSPAAPERGSHGAQNDLAFAIDSPLFTALLRVSDRAIWAVLEDSGEEGEDGGAHLTRVHSPPVCFFVWVFFEGVFPRMTY